MEIAEKERKEKKKIVCVRHNPSAARSAAPPLTQGRLWSAPPVVKMKFHTAGAYGMPPYGVRVSPVWRATGGRPKGLLSDVDAKRQQELPRKRVREHARQRTFCKAEKFIRLSYSRFGGGYPKTNAAFLVARSPPAAHAPPPSRRGACRRRVVGNRFLATGGY